MTPEHLNPIEPAAAVQAVCDSIRAIGIKNYTLHLELEAFAASRAPHDARRLAKALRHLIGRDDLADKVVALIPST